jgi:glycosyltransferase involved in cell wall biosynthesis
MMTAWNTDSGVAIHAEPVGKAWLQMGHQLRVFTFLKDDYHGEEITAEDETFVTRCFGTSTGTNALDPRPILSADYEVFVVQDLGMLPKDKLFQIFPVIKRKAKTVHVVHDNAPSGDPSFYQHDWDAVVYFDPRQEGFLKTIYGEMAHYVPFPCFPKRRGDKVEARRKLGLPPDKKIVVVFCRRGYQPYLPQLPDPDLKDVLFLVLTNRDIEADWPQTQVRREALLPHSLFDEYLFAADALILHKMSTAPQEIGILSSTAYQCLGAGCPILAPRLSDFVWPFEREVLKYADREALKPLLLDVFAEGEWYRESQAAAEEFVEKHSPENVAEQFLRLFASLNGRGTR